MPLTAQQDAQLTGGAWVRCSIRRSLISQTIDTDTNPGARFLVFGLITISTSRSSMAQESGIGTNRRFRWNSSDAWRSIRGPQPRCFLLQ